MKTSLGSSGNLSRMADEPSGIVWTVCFSGAFGVGNIIDLRRNATRMKTATNNRTNMKESGSASMANDPRQPSAAKPYIPPAVSPQDLPVDYAGFLAVLFGVAGAMLRYKLCSWLAIIFCAQSLANMKNFENDMKQISMPMMFAIMGLVTNYFGAARTPKPQS